MRKKGFQAEYTAQRNEELRRALKRAILSPDSRSLDHSYELAVATPASRFWVGERHAADILNAMKRGKQLRNMKPKTRAMYEELYRRASAYLRKHPAASMAEAAFEAVNSPAPEFYLTPMSAKVILSRARIRARARLRSLSPLPYPFNRWALPETVNHPIQN